MANTFQTIASGVAELKNFYQGPIKTQFNDDLPIYRAAEKDKKSWSGQQVIRPLKVRRNQGIGATSDGGPLPSIGKQTTQQAIITSKYNYLRFGVSGPMIKASASDRGSFVRAASYELEEGYNDLRSDVNRQLSWDGTGTLATIGANAAGSTSLSISGREAVEQALKFLDVGIVVDIVNAAGTVYSAQGVTVTGITSGTPNSLTAVVTVDQAVTVTATDRLVRQNSLNQEVNGILTWLDGNTTTVNNIDRSQYISYQGNVSDLGGAQLTLDSLQGLWNAAQRRGGAKFNAHYMDFDTQRYYQKLLTADKRYVNTMQGDGGFSSKEKNYLEFNGIPIVPDQACPQRWFMLTQEGLINYLLAELEFADETGSMMIAQTGSDQFEVRVRLFNNLFNEKPAGNGVLRNYTSP